MAEQTGDGERDQGGADAGLVEGSLGDGLVKRDPEEGASVTGRGIEYQGNRLPGGLATAFARYGGSMVAP